MLQEDHRIIAFRLSPPAVPDLPLRIRSAGWNDVMRGWNEPPVKKGFTELTWTVSGTGEALGPDGYTVLEPGTVSIYWPGETHHLRALSARWVFYWITFDHPDAPAWLRGFGLRKLQRAVNTCPESTFLQTVNNLRAITGEGERQASLCGYQILLAASARSRDSPPPDLIAQRARELIEQNAADTRFNVSHLAGLMGVHRSTVFRHFVDAYHVKPSAFLMTTRLHLGLNHLQDTRISIQEAALAAGFSDPSYFSRAIRAATGKSPRSFRSSPG